MKMKYELLLIRDIPDNRKVFTSKWVFKQNEDRPDLQ